MQTALAADDGFTPFLSSLSSHRSVLVADLLPGTRYLFASRTRSDEPQSEWTNLPAPIECTTAQLGSGQPRVLPPRVAPSPTTIVATVARHGDTALSASTVVEVRRSGVEEPWRAVAAVDVGHGQERATIDGLKPATSYDVRASTREGTSDVTVHRTATPGTTNMLVAFSDMCALAVSIKLSKAEQPQPFACALKAASRMKGFVLRM